LKGHIFRL